MISKKTEREFDSEFNEWDKWPMDLTYRVYSLIIDQINNELEERNEKDCSDTGDTHVAG